MVESEPLLVVLAGIATGTPDTGMCVRVEGGSASRCLECARSWAVNFLAFGVPCQPGTMVETAQVALLL